MIANLLEQAERTYQQERRDHWDGVARRQDHWRGLGEYYKQCLARIYQFLVPPGQKVLELGCSQGNLLAALQPSVGVGIDLSEAMVSRATKRHPELQFIKADAQALHLDQQFDVVILSDLLDDLWDVQQVLQKLNPL